MAEEPYSNPFTRRLATELLPTAAVGHEPRTTRDLNEIKRRNSITQMQMRRTRRDYSRTTGPSDLDVQAHVETPLVMLKPVEVVVPVVPFPEDLFAATIIPITIAQPTVDLVSALNTGSGVPWTTGPSSMLIAPVAVGAMLVVIGRRVLIAMAMGAAEAGIGQVFRTITAEGKKRGVDIKFRTGKGEGRGRYLRPRGPGGEMAGQDADPYDNGDGFSIFEPWTWF